MKNLLMTLAAVVLGAIVALVVIPTLVGSDDGRITMISGPVRTLDPQITSAARDIRLIDALFEPLLRHRVPEMTLELGAAERYEVSEDGRVYTFTIRSDARWSNGDPVLAQDFVTSWRRALMPDMAAYYSSLFFPIVGAEAWFNQRNADLEAYSQRPADQRTADAAQAMLDEHLEAFAQTVGIVAEDDRTLVVTLEKPVIFFPEVIAFATLTPNHTAYTEANMLAPDAASGRVSMQRGWLSGNQLPSNGPYLLASHRADRQIDLLPNPHYWNREATANRGFRVLIIPDQSAAFRVYESGRAQWWPDVPTTSPQAGDLYQSKQAGTRTDVHAYTNHASVFLIFNSKPEFRNRPNPLYDAELRRALSMAIDRQAIVRDITRKNEPVTTVLVPPDAVPGYNPPVESGIDTDFDEARRIIERIGRPSEPISLLFRSDSGFRPLIERLVRDWREQLGVEVNIEGTTNNVFFDRIKQADHTIALGNWFGDYQDPTTWLNMWRTGDSNNMAGWSDEDYDGLLRHAATLTDPGERFEVLRAAETLLLQEHPIAPMYLWVSVELFDPDQIQNVNLNAWSKRRLEWIKRVGFDP